MDNYIETTELFCPYCESKNVDLQCDNWDAIDEGYVYIDSYCPDCDSVFTVYATISEIGYDDKEVE